LHAELRSQGPIGDLAPIQNKKDNNKHKYKKKWFNELRLIKFKLMSKKLIDVHSEFAAGHLAEGQTSYARSEQGTRIPTVPIAEGQHLTPL
jgi:hypothetical protein